MEEMALGDWVVEAAGSKQKELKGEKEIRVGRTSLSPLDFFAFPLSSSHHREFPKNVWEACLRE